MDSNPTTPLDPKQFGEVVSTEIDGTIALIATYRDIADKDAVTTAVDVANKHEEALVINHRQVNSILASAQLHNVAIEAINEATETKVAAAGQETKLAMVTLNVDIAETKLATTDAISRDVAIANTLLDTKDELLAQHRVTLKQLRDTAATNRIIYKQEQRQRLIKANSNYAVEDIDNATTTLATLNVKIKEDADVIVKEAEAGFVKHLTSLEGRFKGLTTKANTVAEEDMELAKAKVAKAEATLADAKAETTTLKEVYTKLVAGE